MTKVAILRRVKLILFKGAITFYYQPLSNSTAVKYSKTGHRGLFSHQEIYEGASRKQNNSWRKMNRGENVQTNQIFFDAN